jgi:hypothetical protein
MTCGLLLTAVVFLPTSRSVAFADTSAKPLATLELAPGQSGKVVVTINPHPTNPYDVAKLVLSGVNRVATTQTNAAQTSGSQTYSSCEGTVGATGSYGQTLWTWTSRQGFLYDGSTVTLADHTGTPSTQYVGWAFDHDFYGSNGNYSAHVVVGSTGYFTYYSTWQRSWGRVTHDIYGGGGCNLSFSSGSW